MPTEETDGQTDGRHRYITLSAIRGHRINKIISSQRQVRKFRGSEIKRSKVDVARPATA